jgi:Ser/Thr protein kinase RdoA (MazF antagonist)
LISATDFAAALDDWLAHHPATARFLAERNGRTRTLAGLDRPLAAVAEVWSSLPSSWAHHDWQGSNLLWTTSGQVSDVIDVGLADRTGPAFDVATALERSMISWLDLTDDPPGVPRVRLDQVRTFLEGYQRIRPLSDAEGAAIPLLLPVVHVELALSEVEYYLTIRGDRSSADLAYEGYLLGHLAFFADEAGHDLLTKLCGMLRR